MACNASLEPCGRFGVSRQAITIARWCGLVTVGMMADRSSVIGLTREYRPNWSFSMILCRDFDRPQWVKIAKVALPYSTHREIYSRTRYDQIAIQRDSSNLLGSENWGLVIFQPALDAIAPRMLHEEELSTF